MKPVAFTLSRVDATFKYTHTQVGDPLIFLDSLLF